MASRHLTSLTGSRRTPRKDDRTTDTLRPPGTAASPTETATSHVSLAADIIIANAPDPVFVSDLEGKILQANDAVSQLLGFRRDEVLEQSALALHQP
jgi:PAS domain-containing protein